MKLIFEVGVIKNGLSIIQETYLRPDELKEINSLLISGFIQVLNDFIDVNFNNLPETLQMETFSAYFHTMNKEENQNQVIYYAFCNKKMKFTIIKPILERVATQSAHIIFDSKSGNLTDIDKNYLQELFRKEIQTFNDGTSYKKKLAKF